MSSGAARSWRWFGWWRRSTRLHWQLWVNMIIINKHLLWMTLQSFTSILLFLSFTIWQIGSRGWCTAGVVIRRSHDCNMTNLPSTSFIRLAVITTARRITSAKGSIYVTTRFFCYVGRARGRRWRLWENRQEYSYDITVVGPLRFIKSFYAEIFICILMCFYLVTPIVMSICWRRPSFSSMMMTARPRKRMHRSVLTLMSGSVWIIVVLHSWCAWPLIDTCDRTRRRPSKHRILVSKHTRRRCCRRASTGHVTAIIH